MDQNTPNNSTKPLTLLDVIRMFKAKTLIIIICVALVAALLGGVFEALLFYTNLSYGTEITFYLTTKDGTHALLPLLNSDSFAEKLLLDENGLPDKADCNEADYNAALEAVASYNDALKVKHECAKAAETLPALVAEKKSVYDSDLAEYTRIYNLLNAYLNAYKSATLGDVTEGIESTESLSDLLVMIAKYEVELDKAADTVAKSKAAYNEINKQKLANDVALSVAKKEVDRTRSEAEETLEKVLAPWRESKEVKEKISLIRESISFEYAKLNENVENGTSVDNENAAFLVITVNVEKDKNMANFIVDRIILRAPDYVEKNIERLTDATDPQCTLISTFADTEENTEPELLRGIILFGAVFGGVTFAGSCVAVVFYNWLPDDMKRKKKASK